MTVADGASLHSALHELPAAQSLHEVTGRAHHHHRPAPRPPPMAWAQQATPSGRRYRADRPKVERKLSHFMRRGWGGRHARVRGCRHIVTDVDARAGAINCWSGGPRTGPRLGSIERGRAVGALYAPFPGPARVPVSWLPPC